MTARPGDLTTHGVDVRVLESFLAGEKRQVWALRRSTGEPVYLAEGQADAMRSTAKRDLKCLHPDCTDLITTKGQTRRAHFAHVHAVAHEVGFESEAHLAGKAMLVEWLIQQLCIGEPPHPVIRAEQSIKDPVTRLNRRPDVLVTGRSGRQVAFEVEYKAWGVEDWEAKQRDLDGARIGCLWLIGHTRVRLLSLVGSNGLVRVPALGAAMARAGKPLLVINPVTRQVGTLAGDSGFTRRYSGSDFEAWLRVDDLASCEFSPIGGLITPALRVIAAAEKAEAERQERLLRERDSRTQRFRASLVEVEKRDAYKREREEAERRAWEESELRAQVVARHGRVPRDFEVNTGCDWGVRAYLAHWHAAIYEDLVRGRDSEFRWRDVFTVLDQHKIRRHPDDEKAYAAIYGWLDYLSRRGLLIEVPPKLGGKRRWKPTGLTLEQIYQAESKRRGMEQRAASESAERRSARRSDLESRRRTVQVTDPDGTRRWVRKDIQF